MEFGFEPVCDQVRAGASYLSPVRSWSKPNSITLSWSHIAPTYSQIASRCSETCTKLHIIVCTVLKFLFIFRLTPIGRADDALH